MTYTKVSFSKIHPDAVEIKTGYNNDVGIDLNIIRIIKIENGTIYLGTGWSVRPEIGYFTELYARSSMHKDGLMLANSIGIIDNGYTGEIIVAAQLTPSFASIILQGATTMDDIDKKTEDYMKKFDLPRKWVQLILRKQENSNIIITQSLNKTERGNNGFGSTGIR